MIQSAECDTLFDAKTEGVLGTTMGIYQEPATFQSKPETDVHHDGVLITSLEHYQKMYPKV